MHRVMACAIGVAVSVASVMSPSAQKATQGDIARNALIGSWRQSGWTLCTPVPQLSQSDVDPPIGELVFRADGTFTVTWTPFETYRDYWGRYTFVPESGALELSIEGGNFVPRDVVGKGTAFIDGGTLTLKRMWLGTKRAKQKPNICELTFARMP